MYSKSKHLGEKSSTLLEIITLKKDMFYTKTYHSQAKP